MLWLACLIALAVETSSLLSLQKEHARLKEAATELTALRQELSRMLAEHHQVGQARRAFADYQELLALREEAAHWRTLQDEQQRLQADDIALRSALTDAREAFRAAHGPDPFAEAMQKAYAVRCVNNLKRVGLAAARWNNKTGDDHLPETFSALSEFLQSPKLLTCPADTFRSPAPTWEQFSTSHVSYQLLSPGAPKWESPNIVFSRCPIHSHLGLADGSVQRVNPQSSTSRLVTTQGVTRWVTTPR
jgi:hypothetical protein